MQTDVGQIGSMRPQSADRDAFIRGATRFLPVPSLPEILLYTADEATALWEMTEDELGCTGLPPPFWAFPWAGGQALARYIAKYPEIVRGRSVVDVASGSGLVAIAAARAGAARVWANDIDPFAQAAVRLNAAANAVTVDMLPGDHVGTDAGWDVVLAGDVAYQRDMAERMFAWFDDLRRRGATVLIGDPGRSYLARDRLEEVAAYDIAVSRSLEDADVKRTGVWRLLRHIDNPDAFVDAPGSALHRTHHEPRRPADHHRDRLRSGRLDHDRDAG